jgi:hypothetical protein
MEEVIYMYMHCKGRICTASMLDGFAARAAGAMAWQGVRACSAASPGGQHDVCTGLRAVAAACGIPAHHDTRALRLSLAVQVRQQSVHRAPLFGMPDEKNSGETHLWRFDAQRCASTGSSSALAHFSLSMIPTGTAAAQQ